MIECRPAGNVEEEDCVPFTYRTIDYFGRKSAYCFDDKGHPLGLHNHTINPDGTVTPSVVCPVVGCGFHEWIKLKDWKI